MSANDRARDQHFPIEQSVAHKQPMEKLAVPVCPVHHRRHGESRRSSKIRLFRFPSVPLISRAVPLFDEFAPVYALCGKIVSVQENFAGVSSIPFSDVTARNAVQSQHHSICPGCINFTLTSHA